MAQGWYSGKSTHLSPFWPGFKSRRRLGMWVRLSLSQFLDILASLAIWLLVDRSSYSNSVMSL